jgi:hypothetical protein
MAKSPREQVIADVEKVRQEKAKTKLETEYQDYIERAAETTDEKERDYYMGLAEDIYVKLHPVIPKLPR